MPQMGPIKWVYMFMLFFSFFLSLSIILYFFTMYYVFIEHYSSLIQISYLNMW